MSLARSSPSYGTQPYPTALLDIYRSIRLNCELFGGKSLFEEQVGSPRHSPRASSLSGLEALPTISDFATQPLTLANFMALRTCKDKTQGDDKFEPESPLLRGNQP